MSTILGRSGGQVAEAAEARLPNVSRHSIPCLSVLVKAQLGTGWPSLFCRPGRAGPFGCIFGQKSGKNAAPCKKMTPTHQAKTYCDRASIVLE